jgi:vacuole morphology and inheritance protein 14
VGFSSTPGTGVGVSGVSPGFDRTTRLKPRDDPGTIKWVEMLEKFKAVQDKSRRLQRMQGGQADDSGAGGSVNGVSLPFDQLSMSKEKALPDVPAKGVPKPASAEGVTAKPPPVQAQGHKSKSSLGNLGRLAGGIGQRKSKR